MSTLEHAYWYKSSYSDGGAQSNCVEVAHAQGVTGIRDSTDPAGPVVAVDNVAFAAFVGVAAGS